MDERREWHRRAVAVGRRLAARAGAALARLRPSGLKLVPRVGAFVIAHDLPITPAGRPGRTSTDAEAVAFSREPGLVATPSFVAERAGAAVLQGACVAARGSSRRAEPGADARAPVAGPATPRFLRIWRGSTQTDGRGWGAERLKPLHWRWHTANNLESRQRVALADAAVSADHRGPCPRRLTKGVVELPRPWLWGQGESVKNSGEMC